MFQLTAPGGMPVGAAVTGVHPAAVNIVVIARTKAMMILLVKRDIILLLSLWVWSCVPVVDTSSSLQCHQAP